MRAQDPFGCLDSGTFALAVADSCGCSVGACGYNDHAPGSCGCGRCDDRRRRIDNGWAATARRPTPQATSTGPEPMCDAEGVCIDPTNKLASHDDERRLSTKLPREVETVVWRHFDQGRHPGQADISSAEAGSTAAQVARTDSGDAINDLVTVPETTGPPTTTNTTDPRWPYPVVPLEVCCCPSNIRVRRYSGGGSAHHDFDHDRVAWFYGIPLLYYYEWTWMPNLHHAPCYAEWYEAGGDAHPLHYRTYDPTQWNPAHLIDHDFEQQISAAQAAGVTEAAQRDQEGIQADDRDWRPTSVPFVQFLALQPGCPFCEPCCLYVYVNRRTRPHQAWARAHCGSACRAKPSTDPAAFWNADQFGAAAWIGFTEASASRWVSARPDGPWNIPPMMPGAIGGR